MTLAEERPASRQRRATITPHLVQSIVLGAVPTHMHYLDSATELYAEARNFANTQYAVYQQSST